MTRRTRALLAPLVVLLIAGGASCSSDETVTGSSSNATSADGAPVRTAPAVGAPSTVPGPTLAPLPGTSGQIADVKKAVTKIDIFAAKGDAEPSTELDNPWLYDPTQPQSQIPRTFLVKQDAADWLEVYTGEPPPVADTAWIKRADVDIKPARYRVEVTLSTFNLKAWDGEKLLLDAPVAIGQGQRPTITGLHFLNVALQPPDPNTVYGSFAFGLSAYSTDPEVLAQFAKGQGAIHGTNDPSSIGRASSNGCIRLSNENITKLAQVLPLGTPVVVQP